MVTTHDISLTAMLFTLAFVFVAMIISYWQQLELERDILVGAVRTVIQLLAIGYVLLYILNSHRVAYIFIMLALMIWVAVNNAAKRGQGIPGVKWYLALAITLSEAVVISILVIAKIAPFSAQYVIPLSGMVIGNSMVAGGLVLNRLRAEAEGRREEILVYLTLGATSRQAAANAIKQTIKAAMIPTVDSMKTVGLVQLPGMMTGLIIAGVSPLAAVKYQVVVMFMIAATAAITSMMVGLTAYRRLFSVDHQLLV
ncbi:MAG: ABC transporter permease [Methylocystaceae bacterium]